MLFLFPKISIKIQKHLQNQAFQEKTRNLDRKHANKPKYCNRLKFGIERKFYIRAIEKGKFLFLK